MKISHTIYGRKHHHLHGVHSCLLSFMAIDSKYVLYFPDAYAHACPTFVGQCQDELIEAARRFTDVANFNGFSGIGFAGVIVKDGEAIAASAPSIDIAAKCDYLVGPMLLPSRLFAGIPAHRSVSLRPWEQNDGIAVSVMCRRPYATPFIVQPRRYRITDSVFIDSIPVDDVSLYKKIVSKNS